MIAFALAAFARAGSLDYIDLALPQVGDHQLTILSPTLLELRRLNTKSPGASRPDSWDFVNGAGQFFAPAASEFAVSVNGTAAAIAAVGFKRRPFYAPDRQRDLRIENNLYLKLTTPIAAGQTVTVTNPSGLLWSASDTYTATADPLRYSPAIHVNQEGYVPGRSKKAMIGYYLGSLGEVDVPAAPGFTLVDATTGLQVYQGPLTPRPDVGYQTTPLPYQKVLEADFTPFNTPGRYRLVVPGLGASLPFLVDDGIAMGFLRTYALGLYHQRCGAPNALPYSRFTHDACHTAPVEVPTAAPEYAFTWTTVAAKNADYADNPRHTAPRLVDAASQLYPFVNAGPLDLAGGHHDAGDYSRYTINSAALVHRLVFLADAIGGAAALDNLGLPESGDGIGDILQEAKREADFLARLQDADGGFYFLVYPKNREYELDVLPDEGDPQVVWPKNTAATAAAVAALAQSASSPAMRFHFPDAAALYLQKAQLGWQFLMQAIAAHGKDGAYQKISFYGDFYMHDDELAWAACELFLATGAAQYHQKLLEWFPNPSDPATFRWGWWRLSESWGNAIRSYAFAGRTGRTAPLNLAYEAACQAEVKAAAEDALRWSNENAYASSFPEETKRVLSGGWYFSLDQASDIAVAYQLDPKPAYLAALAGNMNYEGGTNPVNVSYISGLGQKRQREVVSQYAQNDRRVLPPNGIPVGNIQSGFTSLYYYGSELAQLVFPSDSAEIAPYEFYDRWADAYNLTTEFITVNQARSLTSLAVLAGTTTAATAPWTGGTAQIVVPSGVAPLLAPTTLSLDLPGGLDLTGARIVWEGRDQEPAYGATYTIAPPNNGPQWIEVEIQWPDGRRIQAANSFFANSPVVNWVRGAIPRGGTPVADGGDAWTSALDPTSPAPLTPVHSSNLAPGVHFHAFQNATATLTVGPHDVLFAWVRPDPANPPTEIMLTWNDGSDEHRAYWGANQIIWGNHDSPGRRFMGPLPPAGQWTRLEVPASVIALAGSTVKGMGFILHGGRASWQNAGLLTAAAPTIATPPASPSVVAGTSVTLSVATTGVPTPTLQWRRNGAPIPGATGASLTLPQAFAAHAGNYDVVATNAVGAATSAAGTLTITKAMPAITWVPSGPITFGTLLSGAQLNATASVPGTFTYSPTLGALLGAGLGQPLQLTFTPADNANYQSVATSVPLDVGRASQTIVFDPIADRAQGSPPILLAATASSGQPVTFSLVSGPATLNGHTLQLSGPGTVVVRATQAGTANYLPATLDRSFNVTAGATGFAGWREEKFTPAELADPARSGPNAVYGLDGYSNLVKYALGLEPKQDAVLGLPEVSVDGADWAFVYRRPSDRPDLNYSVEASTNLAAWTAVGVSHTLASTSGAVETWHARYPISTAPNAFFRLKVTQGGASACAPMLGGMKIVVPTGQTRSFSFPLLHAAVGTGAMFGRVAAHGPNFIDLPTANWTPSGLSQAANPYYVRFRTGALAGRTFPISSNTASRVVLVTDGTDLTQAGIVAGINGDVFEIVLADTLETLFGSAVHQADDPLLADNVQVWAGTVWLRFYRHGANQRWQRDSDTSVSPTRNTFLLRPDRGVMFTRRGAGDFVHYITGRVPDVAPASWHQRPGVSFLSLGQPADVSLASLGLQTRADGWVSGTGQATATSDADLLQVWGGTTWLIFYYDGIRGRWQRAADPSEASRDAFVVPAGRPIMVRRLNAGSNQLPLPLPYLLPP